MRVKKPSGQHLSSAIQLVPRFIRAPFFFFLAFGLFLMIAEQSAGFLVLVFVSLFIITLKRGFIINLKDNRYKLYLGVFWIEIGIWQPLPLNYSFRVAVHHEGARLFSRSNRTINISEARYVVYFRPVEQADEILIGVFPSKYEADKFVATIEST